MSQHPNLIASNLYSYTLHNSILSPHNNNKAKYKNIREKQSYKQDYTVTRFKARIQQHISLIESIYMNLSYLLHTNSNNNNKNRFNLN